MKASKPGKGPTLAVLACVVSTFLVVVLVALSPPADPGSDPRPSTFLSGDAGAKGGFLVLAKLFPDVRRWTQTFTLLNLEPASGAVETILVLGPTLDLAPAESLALDRWIEHGGQLILAVDAPWLVRKPRAPRSPFSGKDKEDAEQQEGDTKPEDYLARHGFKIISGVDGDPEAGLFLSGGALEEGDFFVLAETSRAVLAGFREIGEGRLVVVADSHAFSNLRLKEHPRNLAWLARVIDEWSPDRVAFDEYHLGLGVRRPFLAVLAGFLGTPWGLACLQLGIAGLLYLVGTRRRFGMIRDPDPPPARDPLTLVESRAGLLRAANARSLVVELIERYRQRRQSRQFPAPPTGPPGSESGGEYQRILSKAERMKSGLHDADLLRLARLAGDFQRSQQ